MKLVPAEITARLRQLPEWGLEDDSITRMFKFKDFADAFSWMTAAALCAADLNHHPDWRNVYNRVEVRLTTHDVGGLSELDFDLAKKMDELAQA